jgi:diacylglycerol kinase family enzyme
MDKDSLTITPNISARHFFVVNPVCFDSSLKMEAMIAEIHRFFNDSDNSPLYKQSGYAVHTSRFPRDAIYAIQRYAKAVPSGYPLRVYAVGGDGTLFDCLNGVVGLPNVELGIIPHGKKNSLYRIFGENNKDAFNSLEVQTRAPSVTMDALYCGSNYALNHCLIGLEALFHAGGLTVKIPTFLDRYMSVFSRTLNIASLYFTGVINSEILKQNYRFWVDSENLSGAYAFINIVNKPYYADSNKIAISEANPTDGCLDVLACGEINALNSYSILNKYINGHHARYPNLFTYRRAKKVFVSSSQPLILDLDGEIFYDKYISMEIKPEVVRIIVPTQVRQE